MRACVQRVSQAKVVVEQDVCGEIKQGLVVLLGVTGDDSSSDVKYMAEKIAQLRIFNDAEGKMNRSLQEIAGEMLVISQFTLYGDCRKGRRPSFVNAAEPALAEQLYEEFVQQIEIMNIPVATGKFRADMDVSLTNDGPVTMLLDSRKLF